jgi:hypothetical protein
MIFPDWKRKIAERREIWNSDPALSWDPQKENSEDFYFVDLYAGRGNRIHVARNYQETAIILTAAIETILAGNKNQDFQEEDVLIELFEMSPDALARRALDCLMEILEYRPS